MIFDYIKKILIISLFLIPTKLVADQNITRPYPTLEEADGSPKIRYPIIKVPNGSLIDGTTQAWLFIKSTNNPSELNYISNQNILQSGSTFFVSSGSVQNLFSSSGVYANYYDFNYNRILMPYRTGRLYYDDDEKTISMQTDNPEVTLNIGQEQFVRVTNTNGYTILNGQIVYVSGAQGQRPTVLLARSSVAIEAQGVLGMATHNISPSENGYVTTFGIIRGLDTSAFSEGDVLWLSTTTIGAFTNIEPCAPWNRIKIGLVLYSHGTEGKILFRRDARQNAEDVETDSFACNNTRSTVQDYIDTMFSPGMISGGIVTKNANNTVNVSSGVGLIRAVDVDTQTLSFFQWNSSSSIPIPLNSIRYFGISYNSNNPKVVVETDDDWNFDTEFPLGSAINQSSSVYVLSNPWWVGDHVTNIIERIQAEGYFEKDVNAGGLVLGVTGTRNPTLTAGTVWGRLTEHEILALDYSASGSFNLYYRNADLTTYTEKKGFTQYPVNSYDNGSGSTVALTNNWYANWWVFINISSNNLAFIYPQNQYANAASAEAESIPQFPSTWYKQGILIGRITFKQGTDAPLEIMTYGNGDTGIVLASDHGNLAGLTDDDHLQYLRTDGTREMTGQFQPDSYTQGELRALLPTRVGNIVFNSTDVKLYYSTGTTAGSWAKIKDDSAP